MSGFAAIVRWGGPAPEPSALAPALATLRHRGGAGRSLHRGPAAVVGVEQAATTPEDEGVTQPVACTDPERRLVFDGRIDNRTDLLTSLGLAPWTPVSDPELAALALDRWGTRFMERLIGPAAVVIIDHRRRRITLCRDALGDRTVVYAEIPGGLVVASEEQALLALPDVPSRIDEESVARFLAVRAPRPGRTYFAAVREVAAGCTAEIDGTGTRITRHWHPETIETDLRTTDADWVERFRSTLETAVACRLRATTPPAVQMSGGLDSTSVAAHAATLLGPGRRLRTISWVFDELEQADEREFIRPMIDRYGLDATRIVGDELWPMRDRRSWPCSPNMPLEGAYRSLGRATYAAATAGGTTVLLNGEMGDQLFSHEAFWLRDLLRQRRLRSATTELLRTIRRAAGSGSFGPLRPAVGRALGIRRRNALDPPWLTPDGAALAHGGGPTTPSATDGRIDGIVDPFATFGLARETGTAAAAGIDVRRPYRDRRLVELVLGVPAHLFVRGDVHKWILREAGRGLLPEPVRLRRRPSTLLPLCARGLAERGRTTVRSLLDDEQAGWRRYVRADWVEGHLAGSFPEDSIRSVAIWHCLTLDLWERRFTGRVAAAGVVPPPNRREPAYDFESENDYEKSA